MGRLLNGGPQLVVGKKDWFNQVIGVGISRPDHAVQQRAFEGPNSPKPDIGMRLTIRKASADKADNPNGQAVAETCPRSFADEWVEKVRNRG